MDFFVCTDDCVYFIEVKDYQNPNATTERRKEDYDMLIAAGSDMESVFCVEMGANIKARK